LSRARLRLREMLTGYHGERVSERRIVAGGEA
jgi:hypothetical protein